MPSFNLALFCYNTSMIEARIIQDTDRAIEVMHNVGTWMESSGLSPSQWWKPENMNRQFLLKHTESDEYYVAIIDNQPAASLVLQETERNQSWKSVDGDNPKQALYVHWLCVHRDFAGQGLSEKMIEFAEKEAKKRGFTLLRVGADEQRDTAFFQKEIS